jgi:hypothetical protein
MKKNRIDCLAPVTLVVADCQNVGSLFKYRHAVDKLLCGSWGQRCGFGLITIGATSLRSRNNSCRQMGWNCIDVPSQAHSGSGSATDSGLSGMEPVAIYQDIGVDSG